MGDGKSLDLDLQGQGLGFRQEEIEKIIEILENPGQRIEEFAWVGDVVSGIVVSIVRVRRFAEILEIMDMKVAVMVGLMKGFRIFVSEFESICSAVNFKAMEILDVEILFGLDEVEVLNKTLEFLMLFEKHPGIIDQDFLIDHLVSIVSKLKSFGINPFFDDMLWKIESGFQSAQYLAQNISNLVLIVNSRLNLLSVLSRSAVIGASHTTSLKDLSNDVGLVTTVISDYTNYSDDKLSYLNIKITELTTDYSIKLIKKEYESNSYSAFTENAKEELKIYQILKSAGFEKMFVKLIKFDESQRNDKLKLTMLFEKINLKFSDYYEDIICYGSEVYCRSIVSSTIDQILALHSIGIIYNDLSVYNVMINNSKAFLVDFNCSFFIGSSEKCLINTKKIGNKEFLSPELYIALTHKQYDISIDYRKSEYFSFGLFLSYIFRSYFTEDIVKLVQILNKKLSQVFIVTLDRDKILKSDWLKKEENQIKSYIRASLLFDWAKNLIISSLKFDPTTRTLTPQHLNTLTPLHPKHH